MTTVVCVAGGGGFVDLRSDEPNPTSVPLAWSVIGEHVLPVPDLTHHDEFPLVTAVIPRSVRDVIAGAARSGVESANRLEAAAQPVA